MMKCSISPGKILLFGEHFVVKGKPALGLAVSMYVNVCVEHGSWAIYSKQLGLIDQGSKHRVLFNALIEKINQDYTKVPPLNIYVDSKLPIASGMGSSAAIAVATAHAILSYLNVPFTKEDVWKIAHEAEKTVHYKPSGVDTILATYGGFLYYRQGSFRRLDLKLPGNISFIIVNSRVERSTGEVVKDVLSRYERLGVISEYIYNAGEKIVEKALEALEKSDVSTIGELMLVNHGLLWAMGASSEVCDRIVYELIKIGALGGKISGAGRGGIVIGLIDNAKLNLAREVLSGKNYEFYIVTPDYIGVRSFK
ncbi:MAG: mevalonate kinase [Desulfurococcaceae archaeon]